MSVRKRLTDLAGGVGLAVHTVLGPTNSANRDEPQSQTVPDKDYEGVTRSKGGAFKPADEQREDVWRVQSRSSPEANRLFYGTSDAKAIVKANDLGSFDALEGPGADGPGAPMREGLKPLTPESVKAIVKANDLEWEHRRATIAAAGRLHHEFHDPCDPERRARQALLSQPSPGVAPSPHTCHDNPLVICHACLESNR